MREALRGAALDSRSLALMNVLGLCGSLRSQSRSAAWLRAAQSLAPAGVSMAIFDQHGQLPLFNADLESDPPAPVWRLWTAVTAADAIVIASPEYAHGVPGNLKNTLDWLVGHVPFAYKPVAVFNPSYQSHHADDALREILRTMSADLIDAACVRIPVIGSGVALADIAATVPFTGAIADAWDAIVSHVRSAPADRFDG
jgi:chromate reductase, NAD(P)H dehydrogenase (quinone)